METQNDQTQLIPKKKLLIYADAGVKPNPGFGGWGVHGYLYTDAVPKKGYGCQKAYLSHAGYLDKSLYKGETKPAEITVDKYVDGYGAITTTVTNNAGEVIAAKNAIDVAISNSVSEVVLLTDSEHVVKGSTQYIDQWAHNNWIKKDGNLVKNVEHWKSLYEGIKTLREKQIPYTIKWVRGHNGDLGNETVDSYATMGRVLSAKDTHQSCVVYTSPEGYWGNYYERHPLLNHPKIYTTTKLIAEADNEFYCGTHGKEDDAVVGKRMADGAYAYVVLNKPQELIGFVREKIKKAADRDDRLVMFCVDTLYQRDIGNRIAKFGESCIYRPNPNKLDFYFPNKDADKDTPLSWEFNPPLIAHRAVQAISEIKGTYLAYCKADPSLTSVDITEHLYEKTSKGTTQLKSSLGVGTASIKLQAKYATGQKSGTHEVLLTLGIDSLDRNAFKRIEKMEPEVILITWPEGPSAFRYATIVKTNEGSGIWAGYYTNLVLLK